MNDITRGNFLKISCGSIAALSIGGLAGCAARPVNYTPLGVQLYSVRHELDEDFEGTVAKLAEMGYEGLEFADYHGLSGGEIKSILDKYDLHCCGSHVRMDVLRGDAFEETVAFNKAMGNEYFIIRWIEEDERTDRETFMQTIEEYNEVAAKLEEHGMRLGYHNHDYIFEKFGDEYLWDILAENTDDRFILQLDTGHATLMGIDPVEFIHRHPGRTASIHAKAYSATNEEAVVGEDDLDWAGIIEASESVGGIEWYILEYEIEGVPPLEALHSCINNFREIQRG
ncbi:MAG: sugar phosphate isomerase/epimerase [Balneolaceae bacterium]